MEFEAKVKEPQLSKQMQDVVNRSFGEKNNAATDEVVRYKHKIMELLTHNEDLLRTLNCQEIKDSGNELNGDAYRDVCIFDYMKLPEFKTNVRNYVCFEVRRSNPYDTYMTCRVTFRVVCHLDDMKTDWGINRMDLLGAILKSEFDWNNILGISLMPYLDDASVADNDYYYREISYKQQVQSNAYNRANNVVLGR